ncbi:hypothetical protein GCM10022234_00100 [Aeromicrobium panaciterrae]|uniref:DNRLRE domain-containing protein n=1 Tax=Aeromicrobium panaciterrae TaxID=363861 RepID=UPI0031E472DF
MTTLTIPRTSSATNYEGSPTAKYGSTQTLLYMSNQATKRRFAYVASAMPAILLNPNTEIQSAKLYFRNKDAWAGSNQVTATMLSGAWSAANLSWNVKPATTLLTASQTKVDAAANTLWELDVLAHLEAMQAGAPNRGWRLSTNSNTIRSIKNTGADAVALVVEYYVPPNKPTALSPADGQVVSLAKPSLKVTDVDPSLTAQVAIQVQMNSTNVWTAPTYDSGELPSTSSTVDLSTVVGSPTLSPGDTRWWRGRVKGTGNIWSPWSDGAEFQYQPLGTLAILVPDAPPNNEVTDPTPPIGWDPSFVQTAYRMFIVDPDLPPDSWVLYDTGLIAGAADTDAPDEGVITVVGKTYRTIVRSWDGYNRVSNGGVPEYVEASRDFTFELSAGVDPVTALAAVDLNPYPFVKLTWSRTTEPDMFQIVRDGVQIALVQAVDATIGGDDYEWVDSTAAPRQEHTWIVRAIVNGETSATNPDVTAEINPRGIWLCDPENDVYVTVITQDAQSMVLSESGETFTVLNAEYSVRTVSSLRGYTGSITGELFATELTGSLTGAQLRDMFLDVRDRYVGRQMTLTLADMALRVVPFNMTVSPTPHPGRDGDYRYVCSFDFIEVAA